MDAQDTYSLVQTRYGALANQASAGSTTSEEKVAIAFGYTTSDLQSLPQNANLGVSCGNPVATATLREGETVVDLGSGGGIDVFLAARKVGPKGRAIGIDMTQSMLDLARKNANKSGLSNASFIEGQITAIPLPDSTADCVISNCVINLVPSAEKYRVFMEIFRVLKPGGRVAVSDILARKELPDEITHDMALYVGCIAGASQVEEYERYLRDAGFEDALIMDTNKDLNVYKSLTDEECCSPTTTKACNGETAESTPKKSSKLDFNEWAGSFLIYAVKP